MVGDVEYVPERDAKRTSLVDTEAVLEGRDPAPKERAHAMSEGSRSDFKCSNTRRSTCADHQNDAIDAAHFAAVAIHHLLVENIADEVHSIQHPPNERRG